jgi:hypothetical protein
LDVVARHAFLRLYERDDFIPLHCLDAFLGGGKKKTDERTNTVRADVRLVGQQYCVGDNDHFVVSLTLKITVTNLSKQSFAIPSNLVPWVGRIASSSEDAHSGRYKYEVSGSHYLVDSPSQPPDLLVNPGKPVVLDSGYDVVARYRPTPEMSKTVAGTYALQLVLRPEYRGFGDQVNPDVKESITTEPFLFTVPPNPAVIECREGGHP